MQNGHRNIQVPTGCSVAVVGDIHEQEKLFDKLVDQIKPEQDKMILVSVGDVYDKGPGIQYAESIINKLIALNKQNCAYIVKGNHELKHIRNAQKVKQYTEQLYWLEAQPLVITFTFDNSTQLTVLHGGVAHHHTWADIGTDVEMAYIRDLDQDGKYIMLKYINENGRRTLQPAKPNGITWHRTYDGRFGYIAAGHDPQKDGIPKFYNYSCNLDSAVYETNILSCQIFDQTGKKKLIQISGQDQEIL